MREANADLLEAEGEGGEGCDEACVEAEGAKEREREQLVEGEKGGHVWVTCGCIGTMPTCECEL
eukprot:3936155-Rhodomonas_salina.2